MLLIENFEGAGPTLNLAFRAKEVGRAQPDGAMHAREKRDTF